MPGRCRYRYLDTRGETKLSSDTRHELTSGQSVGLGWTTRGVISVSSVSGLRWIYVWLNWSRRRPPASTLARGASRHPG